MSIPTQSAPVLRFAHGTSTASPYHPPRRGPARSGIAPSGFLCGPCESAIEDVVDGLIGMPCAGADAAFEVACNAALDWIPGIGEGPGEAICIAGGIAVGAACEAGGGIITKPMASKIARGACRSMC